MTISDFSKFIQDPSLEEIEHAIYVRKLTPVWLWWRYKDHRPLNGITKLTLMMYRLQGKQFIFFL